eukprot:TRINITY_DN40491_c0_g1_i1.p1 TRINITY_DN40491_c0_g1~~TRINITY_DN40491_c0_g1_i1.p1  ORF type:complete len:330 (+),score=70.84 TRINITY_DN40491_c0_g1_i1:64-990(+)
MPPPPPRRHAPGLLAALCAAAAAASDQPSVSTTDFSNRWLVFQVICTQPHPEVAASARTLMDRGFLLAWVYSCDAYESWQKAHPDVMRRIFWYRRASGGKFQLWRRYLPVVARFGWLRVWVMDDDMTVEATDLARLRAVVLQARLPIMQPAVRPRRRGGHGTNHKHLRPWRPFHEGRPPAVLFTNLVEVQTPILTVPALLAVMGPPLNGMRGLDCVWCGFVAERLPDAPRCACGLIPDVVVSHQNFGTAGWKDWKGDWQRLVQSAPEAAARHNVCRAVVNGTEMPRVAGAWRPPCSGGERRQTSFPAG